MQYDEKHRLAFLHKLEAHGLNISRAVADFRKDFPGFNRRNFYNWLQTNRKFAAAYQELVDKEIDEVESIHKLYRNGIPIKELQPIFNADGTPVMKNGRPLHREVIVDWILKPDLRAIETWLRAKARHRGWRPDIDLSTLPGVPGTTPVFTDGTDDVIQLNTLSDDELGALDNILTKALRSGAKEGADTPSEVG